MQIEHAIFTSAKTPQRDGYHVVCSSPGVAAEDLRELAQWGPTHDSLLPAALNTGSVNFHQLPSGNWNVARTVQAGEEYSGRAGQRIYTHSLVLGEKAFQQFSNDPFRLLEAAVASGRLMAHDDLPNVLEPFTLVGRAAPVDRGAVQKLLSRFEPERIAYLVGSAVSGARMGVVTIGSGADIFAGLLSLLPVECRRQLNFTTGLKHSTQRPFQMQILPDDETEQRRIIRNQNWLIIDFTSPMSLEDLPLSGWAGWVYKQLTQKNLRAISDVLMTSRPGMRLSDLDQLVHEIEHETTVPKVPALSSQIAHAHASHQRTPATPQRTIVGPAASVDLESPEVMDLLQELDDVVFRAIDGNAGEMDKLRDLWPKIVEQLDPNILAESREQYLQYALRLWNEQPKHRSPDAATKAVEVLEVLGVLFE